jgi:hypothetical protein
VRNSRGRPINAPAAFIHPCHPTVTAQPPSGSGWAHELKHIDDAPVPKCLKNFTSLFPKMLPSRLACVTRRCWANPLLNIERGKDAKIVFLHTAQLII